MAKHYQRFFTAPDESFFIFGPRGTGRSTWLHAYRPKAHFIDLLDHTTYIKHAADPTLIRTIITTEPHQCLVIDEIQKVPEMLNTVHQLIEEDKTRQFILTGSSARKLRRSGVNLLAGRALLTKFHPFMAAELGDDFSLDEALLTGLVPLIVSAVDKQKKISAYLSLYLKEEVQAEGLVRNIGDFVRFLEIMSLSHGSLLNLTNIARECHTSRRIVENYLSILEDLLIGYTLPVFNKKAKRATTMHNKFYYFDTGVYHNLRPKGPLDKPDEIYGIALEGLVLQHLWAWRDYSDNQVELYYWRTQSGAEIDFILYGEKCFFAIEVKNSSIIHNKDLRHLKSFCDDYPQATPLLLYRGTDRRQINGIDCWPVTDFLLQLKPKQSIIAT